LRAGSRVPRPARKGLGCPLARLRRFRRRLWRRRLWGLGVDCDHEQVVEVQFGEGDQGAGNESGADLAAVAQDAGDAGAADAHPASQGLVAGNPGQLDEFGPLAVPESYRRLHPASLPSRDGGPRQDRHRPMDNNRAESAWASPNCRLRRRVISCTGQIRDGRGIYRNSCIRRQITIAPTESRDSQAKSTVRVVACTGQKPPRPGDTLPGRSPCLAGSATPRSGAHQSERRRRVDATALARPAGPLTNADRTGKDACTELRIASREKYLHSGIYGNPYISYPFSVTPRFLCRPSVHTMSVDLRV
jgi:hypothetical protein